MTMLTVVLPWTGPSKTTELPYVLSGDGRTVQQHGVAALALLPAARQLQLVVPASRIAWFSLKLPPVGGARLRQVLDGLLEEHLLDEPGQMALAVAGASATGGQTLVAACDKAWLAGALALFEQARRPVARVVPEFAPTQAAGVHQLVVVGGEEHPWLVLCSPTDCLQVPLDQAPMLLAHAAGAFDEAPLRADPEVAEVAEQALGRPAEPVAPAGRWLAAARVPWDLTQFDLAQTSSDRFARRFAAGWQQFLQAPAWRPTRWALALLVAANLVGVNAWAWRQGQMVEARRAELRGVLTQAFPSVRLVVDAPVQMAREVALLRRASGGSSAGDMEVLLSALGAALPEGVFPTQLDFGDGELRAEGLTLDAEQAAQALARAEGAGALAQYASGRMSLRAAGGAR